MHSIYSINCSQVFFFIEYMQATLLLPIEETHIAVLQFFSVILCWHDAMQRYTMI